MIRAKRLVADLHCFTFFGPNWLTFYASPQQSTKKSASEVAAAAKQRWMTLFFRSAPCPIVNWLTTELSGGGSPATFYSGFSQAKACTCISCNLITAGTWFSCLHVNPLEDCKYSEIQKHVKQVWNIHHELNLDWKPLPIRTWADGSFSSVKPSRTGQNRSSNGCIYFWNAVE